MLVASEALLASAAGVAFAIWGSCLPIGDSDTGDVVLAILSYAAIAFGFAIAGLTIALTAPSDDFARQLAWSDPASAGVAAEAPTLNSYSNLLFIFSWTALAHWVVLVTAFSVLVVIGYSAPFLADGASVGHRTAIGILVAVAVYAVALFLVTLITLADVGGTYIRWLQAKRPSESSDS